LPDTIATRVDTMTNILNAAQLRLIHAAATLLEHEGVMLHVDSVGPLTPQGLMDELRTSLDDPETFVTVTLAAHDLKVSREVMAREISDDPLELVSIMVSLREHFVQYSGLEG